MPTKFKPSQTVRLRGEAKSSTTNFFIKGTSKDELIEYNNCLRDPNYFADKYCKIIHLDKGLIPFNLYPYQKEMFMGLTLKNIV